jgi:hypothetical protein
VKLIAATNAVPAQQYVHAKSSRDVDRYEVDDPCRDRRHEHEEQRQRIERTGVEATQQRRARVTQGVHQRQVTRRQLASHEHAQREVLDEVVADDGRVVEQRGHDEQDERDDDDP